VREGGTIEYVVCNDEATLVYLAEQACITPHTWLSRVRQPEHPDRIVFDLDPPGDDPAGTFPLVRWAARELRAMLVDLGLRAFVMSSGSRGLHIVVPLEPDLGFDEVRGFARGVADRLASRHPERLTTAQRKAARADALFLDALRNGYGQTSVAPYAVRARPGAPVAAPLEWDELGRSGMQPQRYTLANVGRRLAQRADPWEDLEGAAAPLREAATGLI
jgi:bifunctional non-homologous end joining protein LigD